MHVAFPLPRVKERNWAQNLQHCIYYCYNDLEAERRNVDSYCRPQHSFTRLTHKIAIQLHLVADSCTICSSHSRWPVWKLLDTPSYSCSLYYSSKNSDLQLEVINHMT